MKSVSSGIAKKSELTFVGHSLGGFLATIASKFTGRDAIVFNPASISGIVILAAKISSLFNGGKITQYRSYGDYVNAVQDLTKRSSDGYVKWVKTEHFISHGIDEIIKSFLRNKR